MGLARTAKQLGIQFAHATVGFEFTGGRMVPKKVGLASRHACVHVSWGGGGVDAHGACGCWETSRVAYSFTLAQLLFSCTCAV